MKTLKEFLHEQAPHVRSDEAVRESQVREWVEAVERLIDQMTQWLRDSDSENILRLEPREVETSEPSLGFYTVPELTIRLGARKVDVSPLAFRVIGPGVGRPGSAKLRGRVDITSGPDAFLLYRLVDEAGRESWLILDNRTFQSQPLTREAFESALLSLLG